MKPEFEAAANWWADAISGPPMHDNGDGLQSMMGQMVASQSPEVTPAQKEGFKKALVKNFETDERFMKSWAEAEEKGDSNWGGYTRATGVDYHPGRLLSKAAESVGINARRFPFKTMMWINPGRVEVRAGYGAEQKVIFEAPAA